MGHGADHRTELGMILPEARERLSLAGQCLVPRAFHDEDRAVDRFRGYSPRSGGYRRERPWARFVDGISVAMSFIIDDPQKW